MLRKRFALAVLGLALFAGAASAATTEKEPREVTWSFEGPFGRFDKAQVQRGYKVYREVCSACHAMDLMYYRNLGQKGGPFYDPKYPNPNDNPYVKSLAKDIQVPDIDSETGDTVQRPAGTADKFPHPFPTESAARAAASFGNGDGNLSAGVDGRWITSPVSLSMSLAWISLASDFT